VGVVVRGLCARNTLSKVCRQRRVMYVQGSRLGMESTMRGSNTDGVMRKGQGKNDCDEQA